jgi:hypothetical protein
MLAPLLPSREGAGNTGRVKKSGRFLVAAAASPVSFEPAAEAKSADAWTAIRRWRQLTIMKVVVLDPQRWLELRRFRGVLDELEGDVVVDQVVALGRFGEQRFVTERQIPSGTASSPSRAWV